MRIFLRIFKFASQGFFRNFWLSLVTITMMLMAVLSVTLLIGIDFIKQAAIDGVEKRVDILVELKHDVKVEDVENFVLDLEDLEEVKDTRVISPADNLELFRASNSDNAAGQALDIFDEDENPFSYSVAIQAYELEQYVSIISFVSAEQYVNIIDSNPILTDYQNFVDKIDTLANNINKYSWYITLVFILISIIVIFNTIRISIYSRKSEIMVMRLVGASAWFIRAPFLLESTFYALVAVAIVVAFVYPIVDLIQPQLNTYFQSAEVINLSGYFKSNAIRIFVSQFIILAILNILSTAIAIRKYLKV